MKAFTLLLALPLVGAAPAAVAQQKAPISFMRGTSSATVSGSIRGYDYRDHTLGVAAGQRIRINFAGSTGSPYFNLLPPGSNDVAVYNSSINGNSYDGLLDRSGLWTIRVYQMRNAARRGAVANYRLTVAVTGRPAPARPWDAKMPGTGYHATGPIDCRFSPTQPFRQCTAGVRRLGNGNAVVEIETGPGSMRRIEIRGGMPVNSNIGAVEATKSGDMFIVRIGAETYRFVEALVFGG